MAKPTPRPAIPIPVVEKWVEDRLANVVAAYPGPHFENSMYGPITSYLHTFFPTNRNFMLKPQGALRPEHVGDHMSDIADHGSDDYQGWNSEEEEEEEEMERGGDNFDIEDDMDNDDEEGDRGNVPDMDEDHFEDSQDFDTSFDSYRGETTSRNVPHSNKMVRIPDFLVVKATESLTGDTLLLIVEVKKNSSKKRTSALQMALYLEIAASKRRHPYLQGLLIEGNRTRSFYLVFPHPMMRPLLLVTVLVSLPQV